MVLGRRLRDDWLRILVHIAALVPLARIVWAYWQGLFVIDPVREITSITGRAGLVLLVASLACTPVHALTGFRQVLRVRRALGLYAFLYAGLHFLAWAGLDYRFDLALILIELPYQRFVLLGITTFLVMLPLAVTSTQAWQRRLGKNWKRLQRLAYVAGILDVAHFLWLVKDPTIPLRWAALLSALLLLRIPPVRRMVMSVRKRWRAA
jgi:sulfoxide reductase heme-binding subunit YedZ